MPGRGGGLFGEPQILATDQTSVRCCTLADLNGDGALDLATSSLSAVPIAVRLGHGDGTFAPAQPVAAAPGPSGIAAGDLNGDGALDLVTGLQPLRAGRPLALRAVPVPTRVVGEPWGWAAGYRRRHPRVASQWDLRAIRG